MLCSLCTSPSVHTARTGKHAKTVPEGTRRRSRSESKLMATTTGLLSKLLHSSSSVVEGMLLLRCCFLQLSSTGGYISGDVARWLESRNPNPKTLGSIPLSLRVNSCADLFVRPDPPYPSLCTARTHMCAHVKDPISICRKRVGLIVGGMTKHENTDTGENKVG